jgi:hypothetical protein
VEAQLKLDRAHDIIDRPEKFAAHFRTVARTQTDIKRVIVEIIRECLESDIDAKKQLKNLIREVEQENWKSFLKSTWGKVGVGIWTVITLALGAFFTHFFG